MSTKPVADPLVGKAVAQYTILAKLGGGGMGVVYQARDGKLGRLVALKFLPPQWSHDENAKQRFIREAQAASATDHPNICTVHAIESTDDGQLFIVMAYYDGQTLKQKLETAPLGADVALQIATQVAEGLAKAHAQGVVHRDIKPGNLMITEDGIKILDFGLAKFADSLQLTIAGSTLGTVAYMSPEQARGEEADARSDIWAVGVVLYEMLTGETPFKGIYPEAISYAIRNDPTPPLKAEARGIPPQVERLVLRALQKDPAARYQSARELARDLRLVQGLTLPVDLRTEALQAVPSLRIPERLPWWRRVWTELTPARAIAVASVLLAAGIGSYRWTTRPVVRIPVAIAPVANHTGEPELDAYRLALTEALVAELTDSPNIRVIPYLRVVEIIRRFIGAGDVSSSDAIQALATQSGARFVVVPTLEFRSDNKTWLARAQLRRAETGTNTDTYETAAVTSSLPKDTAYRLIASLADGIQQRFKAIGPGRSYSQRPPSSRFRNLEAVQAFEKGLNAYEQLEYSATLAAFRQTVMLDDQNALAHAWLSRMLLVLNRTNEAVGAGRRAKQLVTADTPKADVDFIEATLAESQADFITAEARYRELTTLRSDDPIAQAELADFFKRQDRNQQAVDSYHESLRLDAASVRSHVDLCQLYTRLDDHPLAEKHAQTAVENYRTTRNRGGEGQSLLCLGEAQRQQAGNRLIEARTNIEAARRIFEVLGQPYNLSRAIFYQALVEYTEGNLRQATQFFADAAARSHTVGNRLTEGVALMNLGVTHQGLGRRAEAADYYRQSRDVYEQIGDQRRAAEQDIVAAALQIDYGGNQTEALRRLANARAALQKLGYVNFAVVATESEAASLRHAGRLAEARRELLAALSLATERQLSNRIGELTVEIARTDLFLNDYATARKALEDLVARDTDHKNPEARVVLATVLVRLGDFEGAKAHLDTAEADIEGRQASQFAQFTPLVHTALGELSFESGKLGDARGHFHKAAAFWIDDFPDAASVEARSYLGLLDALISKAPPADKRAELSVQQARKMGRLALEAVCRLNLARIHLGQGRYGDALATLQEIPLKGERTIGPELQAQAHYWRSQAMSGLGNRAGAEFEKSVGRKLVQQVQTSLPKANRDQFALRANIRSILK